MNCESFMALLDQYIDGELNAQQESELMDHVAACDNCAQRLKEAEMLKNVLSGMDDDIAVPLEAQAAWRRAVKAEAAHQKTRKRLRIISGIAAALVVVLGGSYFLNADNAAVQTPTLTISEPDALIASDGTTALDPDDASGYSAWKKIRTDDAEKAYNTLQTLSEEYGGTLQQEEDGAYRVELPSQYLDEFLQASSRIGEETDAETGENVGESAIVYIQFIAE